MTVLVVDDDIAVLRLIALILRIEDLEVQTASNGEDALDSLSGSRPDIILLDLSMPGMDGSTFYRMARDTGYTGRIVICSAYGATAAQRSLGADGAIDKPFDPERLVAVIRSLAPTRS